MPQLNIKPHPDTDYPNPDDQLGRMEWSGLGFNVNSTYCAKIIFTHMTTCMHIYMRVSVRMAPYPNPDDQLGRMEWSGLGFNGPSTVLIAVILGRTEKWGGYR
jgi:hypothetical protein